MPQIREEDINRVREKADIVDIISKYIPVIKKGRNYTAVCPFHNDHDPSLSISVDKQIWKCFVCNEGGNVFSFVQKYEKIGFKEAVLKVAEMVGVDLSYARDTIVYEKYSEQQKFYFTVFNDAIDYLSYQLYADENKHVLSYLYNRGYNDDLIRKFHIGYNGENNCLYKFLSAKGYKEKELLDLYLIRNTSNGFSDIFTNRIIFPIYNEDNKPIAFNGRTVSTGQEPKYINASDTPLYNKGSVLYNYYHAKNSVRDTGMVYVVEGVTDVYAFSRTGHENCVATLGTAMAKPQLQLLKNLRCPIILCYDGDRAGQNANYKNAKLLKDFGIDVMVVRNDTDMDPDEIIKNKGSDYFNSMIENKEVFMEFFMRVLKQNYNLENYNQKKEYAGKVAKEISSLKDDFDKTTFINRLAEETGFTGSQLKSFDENLVYTDKRKGYTDYRHPKSLDGKTRAEYEILSAMISGKQAASFFKENIGYLPTKQLNELAMQILDLYRTEDSISVADLINVVEEEELKRLIIELSGNESFTHPYSEKTLKDAGIRIKIALIDDQLNSIDLQIKSTANETEKQNLFKRKLELKMERMTLTAEMKEE